MSYQIKLNAPTNTSGFSNLTNSVKESHVKNVANHFMKTWEGTDLATNANAPFFARELAVKYASVLMKKYAKYRWREYVDVVTTAPWAKTFYFEMYAKFGEAETKGTAAGDINIIEANVQEMSKEIITSIEGIRWGYVEKMAAEATGATGGNYPQAKLEALGQTLEARLNKVLFQGDATYGVQGLLNTPEIPSTNTTAWTGSTEAADKLADMIKPFTEVLKQSKNVFQPNRYAMSLNLFTQVFGEPRSVYSDESILSWVTSKLPGVTEIIADPFLDGALNGNDVIIAMDKNPDHFNMCVPMDMVALPPVRPGVDYVLPFMSRYTGLNVVYADAIHILEFTS